MPCHPARARQLLNQSKAAVYRHRPFTIILKERKGGNTQTIALKIDPGSRTTGIALIADCKRGKRLIWAADLHHKGHVVIARMKVRRTLRGGRRHRKCRYRPPRFRNRRRPDGWLTPSMRSRIGNVKTWVERLRRWTPIASISLELVKFDTQKMVNPEISGIEYQQGELQGYEVREYLLEKFERKCAYCGKENVPLEIEHIVPQSRGGSNRVSNLALSCRPCNQTKGNKTAAEFGHLEVQAKAQQPLRDVAAVNSMRWALFGPLKVAGLPIECGTGGRTKYNRVQQGYPKAHWIDAVCVGRSGERVYITPNHAPLVIRAIGRGSRQMCGTDKYGFPIRHRARQKRVFGFQTGDLVRAVVPQGKYAGTHVGRVTIRRRPSFRLNGFDVHPRYLALLQRADGYEYT
jgi:5-methylcytosine-specific restriction endonuclease McrA